MLQKTVNANTKILRKDYLVMLLLTERGTRASWEEVKKNLQDVTIEAHQKKKKNEEEKREKQDRKCQCSP